MTFHATHFPFILVVSSLLFLAPHSANSAHTLIKQACKTMSKTDPNINRHFCISSLQSAPASQCANLTRLGQMSISFLLKNNLTDTRCLISRLLNDERLDERTKAALQDCYTLYSDSSSTVRVAAKHYLAKRFDDANIEVSSIMDSSTTCDQGFEDVGAHDVLKERNHNTFQLSAIALAFINHGNGSTLISVGGSAQTC